MDNPATPWNLHHCMFCTYKTRFDHYILRHVTLHSTRSANHRFSCDLQSPEKYECEKCHSQFDFKILLTKHFHTLHKTKNTQYNPNPILRYCENCEFQTYSSLVLLGHYNYCNGSGLVVAKDKNSVKLSKETNHSNLRRGRQGGRPLHENRKEDGFFHCNYCSYKTKYSNGCLKIHIRRMHSGSDGSGLVDVAKDNNSVELSKEEKHSNLPRGRQGGRPLHENRKEDGFFHCNHCSYKTKYSNGCLKNHIRRMHSGSNGSGLVDLAKDNNSVELSKEKTHPNQRRGRQGGRPLHENRKEDGFFHCNQCSYKTKYSNGCLKIHMRRMHTPPNQIQWFRCEHCTYKAKEARPLQIHLLVHHTDSKHWFRCEHCSYEGKDKYKLGRHVLLRHTETVDPEKVKYHKCDQCSYKTLQAGKIKVHMLQKHTPPEQINWFQCEHCSYKAKLKGNLSQHVLKMHTKAKEVKELECLFIKLEPVEPDQI